MVLENIFTERVVSLWNSLPSFVVEAPSKVIVFRQDWISFGLTKMLCIILKHHYWEPEVEVFLSVIVSFIILRKFLYRCGHSLRSQWRYEIRYIYIFTLHIILADINQRYSRLDPVFLVLYAVADACGHRLMTDTAIKLFNLGLSCVCI